MATERIDIVIAEDGSRKVKRSLEELGQSAGKSAGMMDLLKKSMIGLGVGSALLKATLDVGAYTTAMAEVSTLIDTSKISMSQLNSVALEQAGIYGSMPLDQAKAMYQIISAGASSAARATEILDASNQLAVGGVTDVATAADGLTSAMNAYGPGIESAAAATDSMFVAMKAGKTTIGELSSSLGVVAPLAAAAGVSFDELMASTAALTKGGVSTNIAMTGLRAIMASVVKPSSEAAKMAASLGLEFSAAGLKAKGFAGFMEDVKQKTGGNTEVLAQLFGGVEALVPVMALTGAAGEDMAQILEDMGIKSGATAEAFEKMANSPGFQSKRVFASITAEVIKLGAPIANFLVPVLRTLADRMDAIFIIGIGFAAAFAWRALAAQAFTSVIAPAALLAGQFGITGTMAALFSVAMDSAKNATNRFTMALLANPFTAMLVVLTLVIAAIVTFGDEIAVTADGTVSLKDAFFAALSFIGDLVKYIAAGFSLAWEATFGAVTTFLASFGVSWSDIFNGIWEVIKFVVNSLIRAFVIAWTVIKTAWNNFPGYFDLLFTAVLNLASDAAQAVLNAWQIPLKFISKGLAIISDDAAVALNGFLSATNITVPKAKLNAAGRAAGGAIMAGVETAMNTDYLGNMGSQIIARARTQTGNGTEEAIATVDDPTGTAPATSSAGAGKDKKDGADKAIKDELTRIGYLQQLRTEAENAVAQADILDSSLRKVQEEVDKANAFMADKKWSIMNATEEAEFRRLIKLREDERRLMEIKDGLLNKIKGPERDLNDLRAATNELMIKGNLTLIEQTALMRNLTDAVNEQNMARLKLLNTTAAGLEMGKINVQKQNEDVGGRIASSYQSEYQKANGDMQALTDRATVLKQLMLDDPINSGKYAQSLREAGLEMLILKGNMPDASIFDGMRAGLARFAQGFKGMMPGLSQAWGNWVQKIGDGFADAVGRAIVYGENLGDALSNVARSAMAELISSLVKLGIQWLIMQVIGQTAQKAMASTASAAGGAVATAWAPAAAMVSLATFGANGIPAGIAIAAVNALSLGFAQAGGGKGFREGGYTGGGGLGDVAGVVHGQEFVVNAAATRDWLPFLEGINSGQVPGYATGGYVGKPGKTNLSSSMILGAQGGVDRNGSNGGGDNISISIDARGAENGVEEKIDDALRQALPVFLQKARKQESRVNANQNRQTIGG
jgi:TP901 family phage tail tape measure protein